jgi:poly(3-hydroxybutyrate) depolymerase
MKRSSSLLGALSCLLLITLLSLGAAPNDTLIRAQNLAKRLAEHEAALSPAEKLGPGRFAQAEFAFFRLQYVLSTELKDDAETVAAFLENAERALARLKEAPNAVPPETGVLSRAYISEIDGSVQPYLLYVPAGYSADRAWPLLVFLHGYDPALFAAAWDASTCPQVLTDLCEREGAILLMPYGRGNTDFMGVGEKDVLDAIEFASREYRVDPGRIILAGLSMGGSGAYTIACHYPDRFAGLTIFTGRVDYYLWMETPRESFPRFKQIWIDTDYAAGLLSNLQHVPVLIYHGTADLAVKLAQSRAARDRLTGFGEEVRFHEVEGADHYDFGGPDFIGHADVAEMLRSARRTDRPGSVRFRTYTTKYPASYWVRIDEIEQWGEAAEIAAEAMPDNTIRVRSENVASLSLGPDFPTGVDAAARVILNDKPVEPVRDGNILRMAFRSADGALLKTTQLCGPIREAFSDPFVLVYPGGRDQESRRVAQDAVRFAREWVVYAQGMPQLLPDSAVTDDTVRDFNLVLFGPPEINRVFGRIADQLPFQVERDRVTIGTHAVPLAGNGFQSIYPNPLNPKRYVVIVLGAPWGASLPSNHKLDFLPDFIVYAADPEPDGTFFPTNRWVCAGYFDSRWQVSESSLWINDVGLQQQETADTLDIVR